MKHRLYKYRVVGLKDGKVCGFDLTWFCASGATKMAEVVCRARGIKFFTVMPPA